MKYKKRKGSVGIELILYIIKRQENIIIIKYKKQENIKMLDILKT